MIHQPDYSSDDPDLCLSSRVADDLVDVFGAQGLSVTGAASGRARQITAIGPRTVQKRSALSQFGAVAAAALVGLSAGVYFSRPPIGASSQAVAAPGAALMSTSQESLTPLVSTLRRTVHAAPTPVESASLALDAASSPPPRTKAEAPRNRTTAPVAKRRAVAQAPRACPGGDDQRPCDHGDVMAADRGLRRAYERAAKAGVPRATLVAVRQKWVGLMREGSDRPERLVSGFLALSGDLARATNMARSGDEPRRYAQS